MLSAWFKSLGIWQKVTAGLLLIIFIGYQVMSLRYEYMRHQWLKQIHEEKTLVEEKQQENLKKQDTEIDAGITTIKNHQTDLKSINNKFKKREETIDNSDYSITKLDSLLAVYGN